jgi:hypothetical protein
MLRTVLFTALALVAIYAFYAALLASWSVARDSTLTTAPKFGRLLLVWLVPLVGAMSTLRAAAELSPESLPPRPTLVPLLPLLYVRAVRANSLADHDDLKALGTSGPSQHD